MYADKCFVIVLRMYYYMHTFYKQGKVIPIYQYQRYIWEEIKFYVVFTDMCRKKSDYLCSKLMHLVCI